MDNTWRKAKGTKIADDGTLVRLAIETIDGRQMTVDMVPEMIPLLAAELMNAKTQAERGRSLIQIELAGGGVFEFLVPLKYGYDHTVE